MSGFENDNKRTNSSRDNALWKVNYLLKATVIVSVELAHGQRASGFKPFASKAFTKESQADKDPRKKNK